MPFVEESGGIVPLDVPHSGLDQAGMTWTTDKLNQVGWFWYRKDHNSHVRLVKISDAGVVLYLRSLDESGHVDVTVRPEDCSGEWAGPIVPPV